ncbi:uncharacterized protein J8A68_005376 [[Candida] subhashii]|uniref:LrgB-domain-containing protein n=1 Tax=[Candida] subhashii TaxID=561895 RepID=A0A8J5QCV5_9ASCO|nr:uncharacterized protein J8A68_005376 [[Candida] subhashii]KAG7661107.1 hypothetical protein J8A68_005376 [[Candida] subhashii]
MLKTDRKGSGTFTTTILPQQQKPQHSPSPPPPLDHSQDTSSASPGQKPTFSDLVRGVGSGLWYSGRHLLNSYVIIPGGILTLLVILYGLDKLLVNVFKVTFPCSVLGLLINLVFLCGLSIFANMNEGKNESKLKKRIRSGAGWILTNYLTLIKPSMNFTLKWINVFFIPSFIVLPLSAPITFIECLKIAGVFVFGLILLIIADVWFIRLLRFGFGKVGYVVEEKEDENENEDEEIDSMRANISDTETLDNTSMFSTIMRDDITTIDVSNLRSVKTEPTKKTSNVIVNDNPYVSKPIFKSMTITNSVDVPPPLYHRPYHVDSGIQFHGAYSSSPMIANQSSEESSIAIKSNEVVTHTESEEDDYEDEDEKQQQRDHHNQTMTNHSKRITVFVTKYIDWIFYILVFIISLPFYYIPSIHNHLAYHLGITIISYYIALIIPQKYPITKKFAHPILISTTLILFICFIGSLIYYHGQPRGFLIDLRYYKTGRTYLTLFDKEYRSIWPGFGDVLCSLMDVSIVSLSLPMFTHRRDFIKNFWFLMPTLLISVALTFFLYPITCHAIGIEAQRSIGFIGRSVTLALGTPLIQSLGGSVSLMAVSTVLSGIVGVLINEPVFRLLRVDKNDYVTRGVTLGINSGAIGTAYLLNVDPRAASISSLSFGVFGTIMVIMASIVGVRELIRSWVGLG